MVSSHGRILSCPRSKDRMPLTTASAPPERRKALLPAMRIRSERGGRGTADCRRASSSSCKDVGPSWSGSTDCHSEASRSSVTPSKRRCARCGSSTGTIPQPKSWPGKSSSLPRWVNGTLSVCARPRSNRCPRNKRAGALRGAEPSQVNSGSWGCSRASGQPLSHPQAGAAINAAGPSCNR
jgi:hypothetical protein